MTIHELTPAQLRQAADIKDQIATLEQELASLLGSAPVAPVATAAEPVKATKGTRGKPVAGVTGMILKKVSDQAIKDFIGPAEKLQAQLVKEYGQFIPKRLADMKKAGLVTVRKDGLKKIWQVV